MTPPDKPFDILIVDDEPKNLQVLREMLVRDGYFVRPVRSGEMALKAVDSKTPDLILPDIMMPPGMDGYEVCRRLLSSDKGKELSIIFISALHDIAEKVRAFQVGGRDYITKPFQVEEVRARVKTI
jgi:DNA-binding response OmpR family regulator